MSIIDFSVTSEVDINVWHAIVGAAIEIPPIDTYVYYFPQGHLEQSSPTSYSDDPINYNFILLRPLIPCQVLSLNFLAKYSSDQPYVKILLQPLRPLGLPPSDDDNNEDDDDDDDDEDEDEDEGVVSFVKILTYSDTNVGGFLIPRYCAEMILPQLDYTPVQTLVMKDVHNTEWNFRHVYRGTPRRHVLTTGWSDFVVAKRLVAGDSVVFIKKKLTDELFIGIRRAHKFSGDRGDGPYERLRALATIATAARGRPFEVVYHPGGRVPEFVVKAEKVKEAVQRRWRPWTRVRMAVETDDSSRLIWIQGVVIAVLMSKNGMWCGSPWRTLQISWDDPESGHVKRVSPWQVECITQTATNDPHYHPCKRLKAVVPMTGESSSYNGARVCGSSSSTVSTCPSMVSSSNDNSTVQLKDGSSTFQLFGKTIKVSRPPDEEGCTNLSLTSTSFTRFYFI